MQTPGQSGAQLGIRETKRYGDSCGRISSWIWTGIRFGIEPNRREPQATPGTETATEKVSSPGIAAKNGTKPSPPKRLANRIRDP